MNFNRVIIGGNLTRDPETRFTQGGMAVTNVGIAVNEKWSKDGHDQERTTFVDVTLFGKRGEAFAKYHHKGAQAFVEGRLRLDTWQDKSTGDKRTKLYVVADNWEFVGGSKSDQRQAESTTSSSNWGGGDSGVTDTPF